jgi:hypothetical protein
MPSTPEVLRVKECAPTFFSRCFILGPPLGLLSSLGACHPFCLNFIMFWSKVSIWFTIQLLFLTFHLSSPIFCTTFHMRFGLPHPSIAGILRHVCTHNNDPMGIHLLCCVHDNERIGTHDVLMTPLSPLHEMLVSMWDENDYMRFLQSHSIPFVDDSTLCLPKMTFAP